MAAAAHPWARGSLLCGHASSSWGRPVQLRTAFSQLAGQALETPRTAAKAWPGTGRPQQCFSFAPARSGIVGIRSVNFRFYTVSVLFPAIKEPVRPRPALPRGARRRAGAGKLCVAAGKGLPVARPLPRAAAVPGSWVPPVPEWPGSIPLPDCCWAYPQCGQRPGQSASTAACRAAAKLRAPAASCCFSSVRWLRCTAPGQLPSAGAASGISAPNTSASHPAAARMRTPPGQSLCPRTGTGRRQRKYQICPALQGGLHPHRFRQQRQCAALGQPAAHGHRHMLCFQRFCLRQLPCMAVVKGGRTRNDTGKFS